MKLKFGVFPDSAVALRRNLVKHSCLQTHKRVPPKNISQAQSSDSANSWIMSCSWFQNEKGNSETWKLNYTQNWWQSQELFQIFPRALSYLANIANKVVLPVRVCFRVCSIIRNPAYNLEACVKGVKEQGLYW